MSVFLRLHRLPYLQFDGSVLLRVLSFLYILLHSVRLNYAVRMGPFTVLSLISGPQFLHCFEVGRCLRVRPSSVILGGLALLLLLVPVAALPQRPALRVCLRRLEGSMPTCGEGRQPPSSSPPPLA